MQKLSLMSLINEIKKQFPDSKGLIFDLDGTLVNSMPVHKIAWKEICTTKNFDFTDEIFYKYAGVPSEEIFRLINEEFNKDFDPEYHSKLKEEAYQKNMHLVKPFPMVLDVVKYFYGKIPMAIGTGSPRSHSEEVLQLLKLNSYFNVLVTKDDVENGKPAPDTFVKCAAHLGVDPKYCVVFEDGDPGIEAAKNAKMEVIDVRKYL